MLRQPAVEPQPIWALVRALVIVSGMLVSMEPAAEMAIEYVCAAPPDFVTANWYVVASERSAVPPNEASTYLPDAVYVPGKYWSESSEKVRSSVVIPSVDAVTVASPNPG